MDGKSNRKTTRLSGYDYNTPGAYFMTICTREHRCILSRIVGTGVLDGPTVELLPFGQIAQKYIRQMDDFYQDLSVDSFVIMPNHIHILLQVRDAGLPASSLQNSVISRFISTFKRFCNKEYGTNIWQSRSYDHIIRDEADYNRHLQYIRNNPHGWQKDELYSTI